MTGRPDPYVLARFLDALQGADGQGHRRSKSSLQRACRVNYDVFRRYLDFCQRKGFVEVTPGDDGDAVHLTAEGHVAHRRLVEWIHDLLGDVRL